MISIMTGIEISILDAIRNSMSSDFLDIIMPAISGLGNGGMVWILLAIILLIIPRTRRLGMIVSISIIIEAIACNIILKPLVARTRPNDVNTAVQLLVASPRDYSFPSGHTGAAFAAAGGLFFGGGSRCLWIPAGVLAALMAFSRLYLYVHYPTDVLGGVILGIASAYLAGIIVRRISNAGSDSSILK